MVSTEPVVVMDTILVVRPRQVQFKWSEVAKFSVPLQETVV
ncbi:hypothetical protein SFK315_0269 [Shigella flexneri K-315]|uniref:Uncharacterized protein n=1 Tax=Shigella flexneri K-315 TaxID=766150 RepID=I6D5U6_SHIFL|nr:hypothetical protein SFK315_0269 [Shigella flexneri K-315]